MCLDMRLRLKLKDGRFECWERLKPDGVVPMESQISSIRQGWYSNLPYMVRATDPDVIQTIEQEPTDPA